MATLLLLTCLHAACNHEGPSPVSPSSNTENSIDTFLKNAERQSETDDQRREIQRALRDMLNKSPEELRQTLDHTGLVIRVTPAAQAGGQPAITIRHDSSGQGRVAENDFATYFHGHGAFYR